MKSYKPEEPVRQAGQTAGRVPKLGYLAAYAKQAVASRLIEHQQHIREYGEDMPEIRDWTWPSHSKASARRRKRT
jgi:phosphoketolase